MDMVQWLANQSTSPSEKTITDMLHTQDRRREIGRQLCEDGPQGLWTTGRRANGNDTGARQRSMGRLDSAPDQAPCSVAW